MSLPLPAIHKATDITGETGLCSGTTGLLEKLFLAARCRAGNTLPDPVIFLAVG